MSDFWSRRKAAARAAELAETEAEAARAEAEVRAAADAELAGLPEAELLERLGLPDPDAVASGDDVAAFLARAVPGHIRNRALRSLWRSNPVLACRDGLNDYDGDFTGDGLGGGALRTAYAVGKGLAAHVERLAEIAPAQGAHDNPDGTARVSVPQPVDEKRLAATPPDVERSEAEAAPEGEAVPVAAQAAPTRRMRFTFEEDRDE